MPKRPGRRQIRASVLLIFFWEENSREFAFPKIGKVACRGGPGPPLPHTRDLTAQWADI
jgi:hypothetical protein